MLKPEGEGPIHEPFWYPLGISHRVLLLYQFFGTQQSTIGTELLFDHD